MSTGAPLAAAQADHSCNAQLQRLAAGAVPLLMPALRLQGPDLAIHHGDEVLDGMNAWSCEHHGASGLTARCRASTVSMQVRSADWRRRPAARDATAAMLPAFFAAGAPAVLLQSAQR
jgi:hypothetical protein